MILLTNKIYMENPYLKEIDAKIIEKIHKNNSYHIKLDRTIFYPHLSGGQPRDMGTINNTTVLDVYEDGRDIVHVINKDISTNSVKLAINWDNRFDLMQQHSGQHLLSSSFYRLLNAYTDGFHIGKESVYIDITKPELTEEEIQQVEFLSNKIIQSNFKIKSYIADENELSLLPIRKEPNTKDDIRIVEIDSIDYSPCCGTHVYNTGEIGLIKITRWNKYKNYTRVEFICGSRAIKDYTWKNQYIKEIGLLFTSKDKDVLKNTKKLINDVDNLKKENKKLKEELLKYRANSLLNDSKPINGIKYIVKEFKDISINELRPISSYLNSKDKIIQIYSISDENVGQFFISRSQDLKIDLKKVFNKIAESIIIKGGGSNQTVQGVTAPVLLNSVIKKFYDEILINCKG